jgi:hypothetical protein
MPGEASRKAMQLVGSRDERHARHVVLYRDRSHVRALMIENQAIRPSQVIGPLGEPLTLDSLPPRGTTRWVIRRKAEVVAAVDGGLLDVDEACRRWDLTLEELTAWQRAVDRSGLAGLRVTRIQHYREKYQRLQAY